MDFQSWRHVFKLDPNKPLDDSALAALIRSGTDAFLIGGTDGVDAENTFALYTRLEGCGIPLALEMSHPEQVIRGFDHYFIPTVLNAGTVDWVIGHQTRAFERYGHLFHADVTGQGYIVLNPDAKVAHVTEAAYDNPKFVEDIVRDLAVALNREDRIVWYQVNSENFESIHNHNAYAMIERDKRQ